MARYRQSDDPPATLTEALESRTVDTLKDHFGVVQGRQRATGRKAELVAPLRRELQGVRLRAVWERLDGLERAALAEAAHDPLEHRVLQALHGHGERAQVTAFRVR